jgi:hypothetical protein
VSSGAPDRSRIPREQTETTGGTSPGLHRSSTSLHEEQTAINPVVPMGKMNTIAYVEWSVPRHKLPESMAKAMRRAYRKCLVKVASSQRCCEAPHLLSLSRGLLKAAGGYWGKEHPSMLSSGRLTGDPFTPVHCTRAYRAQYSSMRVRNHFATFTRNRDRGSHALQ